MKRRTVKTQDGTYVDAVSVPAMLLEECLAAQDHPELGMEGFKIKPDPWRIGNLMISPGDHCIFPDVPPPPPEPVVLLSERGDKRRLKGAPSDDYIEPSPNYKPASGCRWNRSTRLDDEEETEAWAANKGARFCNHRKDYLPSEHQHSFWRKRPRP